MSVEIRVPSLGESVTEATVAKWFKQVGEQVNADEPIVELETDKVTLEFNAPASGTLAEIVVEEGGEVEVGALLGSIAQDGANASPARHARAAAAAEAPPRPRPRRTAAMAAAAAPCRRRSASCSRSTASTRRRSPRPAPRATSPRATCWPRSRPGCAASRRRRRRRRAVSNEPAGALRAGGGARAGSASPSRKWSRNPRSPPRRRAAGAGAGSARARAAPATARPEPRACPPAAAASGRAAARSGSR